jgi:hypothetical protein
MQALKRLARPDDIGGVYWLFREPIPSTEMARVERALKLLADMVGGDREPTQTRVKSRYTRLARTSRSSTP